MAYEKTNWTSTTPINTTNLNKIEEGISANDTANTNNTTNIGTLSNLNTTEKSNLVGAINEVNTNDINKSTYSTSEQKIGTWIDGKPLYRKVLSVTGLSGNTIKSIAYNITNINEIWIENGFVRSDGRTVILPMVGYNGDLTQKIDVWVEKQENVVKLYSNGGWGSDWTFYVIINYTKTTD